MMNLDDPNIIKQLDPVNVLGSISQLDGQCAQTWQEVPQIVFPEEYRNVTNVVFSGMGGSALGAYVLKSLFFDKLSLPFEIVNDYRLPTYVNEKTLVILASYSGTTEETLACAQDAYTKKAKMTGLTTGGKLAEFFNENQLPAYIFKPTHNPSNQPRLGTGYSVFGQIAMLNTLGLLDIKAADVNETIEVLKRGTALYTTTVPETNNPTKLLAKKFVGKIPIIVSAEFLTHVGRVIRNQIHESAKSFAAYHEIPELNHHLMESLTNPKSNKDNLIFFFINSGLYSQKARHRMEITEEVVTKQGIEVTAYNAKSRSQLAQVFECIQYGAFVNYYLALSYGIDPSQIPWVDYFKKRLKELG